MNFLNEQTIKRLQKLAGINEIKILSPRTYLPRDMKEFLDKKLSTETDFYYLLLGWLEGTSGEPEEGYITDEGNWEDVLENYKDRLELDPEIIKFLERAKGMDNVIYLSNIYNMFPQEYNNQEGYNDIKIEFKGEYYTLSMPHMNDTAEHIGYFDNEGTFHFFN